MSSPQRYLTRSLIFLALIFVVALTLSGSIARAFLVNPGLNGLILGTLLFGLYYAVRQIAALKTDVQWVDDFRRAEAISGVGEAPPLLAPLAATLGEQRDLTPLASRTVLDGIAGRLDESREISRYIIGLLIFLGLLGTFWGLVNTIGAISDTIKSLSITSGDVGTMFDTLKAGIEKPLSGMGTAFSSSLFGLAGSLILGFVDLQAGQAQNRFFNELEDWLATVTKHGRGGGLAVSGGGEAVPSYVAALLEQTAESLNNLQRTVSRAEDARGDANTALRTLAERLHGLTDQRQREQDLLLKLVEAQNDTRVVLGRLTDTLAARTEKPAAVIDDATRGHLRNLDVHVKHLVDGADRGRDQMIDDIRGEIKLLARTLGAAMDGVTSRTATPPATPAATPAPGSRRVPPLSIDDDPNP